MFITRVREGQQVQIGDRRITVVKIIRPGVVEIKVDGENLPTLVAWDRKLDLFPGVIMTVEKVDCYAPRVKLLFDAPWHIRIREIPLDRAK